MTLQLMVDAIQKAARDYVLHVCQVLQLTPSVLADRAGLSSTTLTRFLNNPTVTHSLSLKTLSKIATYSNVPLPPPLSPGTAVASPGPGTEFLRTTGSNPVSGRPDLPVFGHGRAGEDVLVFENGIVERYVERPWFLLGSRNAYAVYVNSDCMEPAYKHGQLCYVDPALPPSPGDDVLVQLQDGRGYIKRLDRRTADQAHFLQYNPKKRITFKTKEIKHIHVIVASLKIRV